VAWWIGGVGVRWRSAARIVAHAFVIDDRKSLIRRRGHRAAGIGVKGESIVQSW
jgi:hypothetical protein